MARLWVTGMGRRGRVVKKALVRRAVKRAIAKKLLENAMAES